MKFFASKRTQRVANFSLAVMLVVSTITASVPFLFSQNADAASTVTVTASNPQGWTTADTRTNGHVSFVADTSNGSLGALSMVTDAVPVSGQDKAQYMYTLSTPVALSSVTDTLGFDTKQNSASFAAGTPSYQIPVFLNGVTGTNFATLVYEPYVDQGNAAVINGVWQHWDINYTTSKFYSTRAYTGQGGSIVNSQGSSTYTLAQIKEYFPNAVVLGYGLNVGSNNPGYNTEADNFTFNGTTYNFEVVPLSAPTNLTPADNTYTNDTAFSNTWGVVAGAAKYEYTASYDLNGTPMTYTDTSDAGNYEIGAATVTRHNSNTPESTYTWKVRAIDATGNPGAWSVSQKVTVDTTAPSKPVNALPSNGSYLTTNEFDFDWNDSTDASPLTYEFHSSQDPSRDANDVLNGSNIWTSGTLPTSMIHSSGAGNGAWFYQVRAKDAAGNYSQWSDIWSVTIDSVTPTAVFTFPARGPSATSFTVTYSEDMNVADAKNPANYFLNNWPGAGGSGDLAGDAIVTYNVATKTATVNFSSPAWYVSGEQQWGVSGVRDLAGNAIASTTAYSTDLTSPTAPGTPTTTTPTSSFTSNWTWTAATDLPTPAEDASGLKGYEYKFTRGEEVVIDWTATTETSVTTTVTSDGTYQLHVRALDNAGSPAGPESVGTVVIDTTDPVVTIATPVNGATFGNDAIVGITGSTGDATSFTLSIGKTGEAPIITETGANFSSYNWDTSGLASDSYIATLTGTDAVGNSSIAEVVIVIDNSAPVVAIDPQTNTNGNQPTITGTVDDVNATLIATFDGIDYELVNDNGTYSFTAPTPLVNGSYLFTVEATDALGNASSESATVIVAVVTPAPSGAAPTVTTTVTPIITNPGAVLGTSTDEDLAAQSGAADVEGATDDKVAAAVDSEANKGSIFGLAWYWWILIIAGLAAIAWAIIAALRRRNEEQA